MINSLDAITGVILAGGRAERMGGRDKGLLPLAGKPLISYGIRRLQSQVATLLISANRNLEIYQQFGYPVIRDNNSNFQGPLAGILAALQVAKTPYLLTIPCDSPLLPFDYVQRMQVALEQQQTTISVRYSDGYWQPVFTLLSVHLQNDLAAYLAENGGSANRWLQRHHPTPVEFPEGSLYFRNVNTRFSTFGPEPEIEVVGDELAGEF